MSRKRKIAQGIKLYSDFTGRDAKYIDTVPHRTETVAVALGHVVGIAYEAVHHTSGRKRKYFHEFKKGCRPVLAVSTDGKQLLLLAGAYTFTSRGIVDKK